MPKGYSNGAWTTRRLFPSNPMQDRRWLPASTQQSSLLLGSTVIPLGRWISWLMKIYNPIILCITCNENLIILAIHVHSPNYGVFSMPVSVINMPRKESINSSNDVLPSIQIQGHSSGIHQPFRDQGFLVFSIKRSHPDFIIQWVGVVDVPGGPVNSYPLWTVQILSVENLLFGSIERSRPDRMS